MHNTGWNYNTGWNCTFPVSHYAPFVNMQPSHRSQFFSKNPEAIKLYGMHIGRFFTTSISRGGYSVQGTSTKQICLNPYSLCRHLFTTALFHVSSAKSRNFHVLHPLLKHSIFLRKLKQFSEKVQQSNSFPLFYFSLVFSKEYQCWWNAPYRIFGYTFPNISTACIGICSLIKNWICTTQPSNELPILLPKLPSAFLLFKLIPWLEITLNFPHLHFSFPSAVFIAMFWCIPQYYLFCSYTSPIPAEWVAYGMSSILPQFPIHFPFSQSLLVFMHFNAFHSSLFIFSPALLCMCQRDSRRRIWMQFQNYVLFPVPPLLVSFYFPCLASIS